MNIGVCGVGTIASWVSSILNQLNADNICLYACADINYERTVEFKEKFRWQVAHKTIDDLMQDPQVDIVYVAVPNNFHYDLCIKALNYGKNVICEKPFAVNATECQEIIDLAREKNLFLAEALWSAFLPSCTIINNELSKGTIGEVKCGNIVMMDFVMFLDRVKKLETGGGSLLDGGPYTLGRMVSHFGTDIKSVKSSTRKLDSGVDAEDKITVTYNDGRVVTIRQSIDTPHDQHEEYFEIIGTKGRIWGDSVSNPRRIEIFDAKENSVAIYSVPPQIKNQGMPPVSGYEYQWIEIESDLSSGKKEATFMPLENTLAIAKIMTEVRSQAGIVFPFEKK